MSTKDFLDRVWERCHVLGKDGTALLLMPSGEFRETLPPWRNVNDSSGSYIDVISLMDITSTSLAERIDAVIDQGLLHTQRPKQKIIDEALAKAEKFKTPTDRRASYNHRLSLFDAMMTHPGLTAFAIDNTNIQIFAFKSSLKDIAAAAFRYEDQATCSGYMMPYGNAPYASAVLVQTNDDYEINHSVLLEEVFHTIDLQRPTLTGHYSAAIDFMAAKTELYAAIQYLKHIEEYGMGAFEDIPALGVVLEHEAAVVEHHAGEFSVEDYASCVNEIILAWARSLDIGWNGGYSEDLKLANLPYAKAEWFAQTARELWLRCQDAENAFGDLAKGADFYSTLFGSDHPGAPLNIAGNAINHICDHWNEHGYEFDISDFIAYVEMLNTRYLGQRPQGRMYYIPAP